MNTDRRDISPLLLRFFPHMVNATSDDWHFFLDTVCGIETSIDAPNGEAFDRWREKLAEIGYNTLKYHSDDVARMKAKAAKMLEAEQRRAASEPDTLKGLREEAPNWTAAEVLSRLKAKVRK